jgi:hypothetical protein
VIPCFAMTRRDVSQALQQLGVDVRREAFGFSEVVRGAAVELEHTSDPLTATKIALDHLREIPDYYERLARMERGAKRMSFRLPGW